MGVASVLMLINLSFGIGTTLYLIHHRNSTPPSPTFSKIHTYLVQCISMMYRWCLVAASFDRYAITSTNQRLRKFASMKIARGTIIGIIITWIVLPIHNLIYNTANMNIISFKYNTPLLYYHSAFTVVAGCILPASLMIICALLTHRNLVLKRKRRQNMVNLPRGNNGQAKSLERKRDGQILLLLIVQVVVFVITIFPLTTSQFYNAVALNIKHKSIERITIERFAAYWASLTVYLFPTLSFYLYTMTSVMFRNELKKFIIYLIKCGCIRRNIRIAPN